MIIQIKDISHLDEAAARFLNAVEGHKLFAFYGAMGSGKTTFIKTICSQLGALNTVTSPTFTLVNEYKSAAKGPLYHIDFYRIRKKEEVYDFGIEEYFESGNFCFMEWPELIEDIIPPEAVKTTITVNEDDSRTLLVLVP